MSIIEPRPDWQRLLVEWHPRERVLQFVCEHHIGFEFFHNQTVNVVYVNVVKQTQRNNCIGYITIHKKASFL